MSLPTPNLDDRKFQDLVDEAKKRIPLYCPEWTDHNVSDPGVTMIELFAWMTETILYRLNQLPEIHYRKFMEMFGVTLKEPLPAQADVDFWLSAPLESAVSISKQTEVSTTQTEITEPIVFTTDIDFDIVPPKWVRASLRRSRQESTLEELDFVSLQYSLEEAEGIGIFSDEPKAGDALYLGFENDLSHHILRCHMRFVENSGVGVDPKKPPPYHWQGFTGEANQPWTDCDVGSDSTGCMNKDGQVELFLPQLQQREIGGHSLFWIRVELKDLDDDASGTKPFQKSPKLLGLTTETAGCTIPASHSRQVDKEMIGESSGEPNQRFRLQRTPLLKRESQTKLTVHMEGEPEEVWEERTDFADSDAYSKHYTVDGITGEICFGPAVRQPDGTIKLYGKIPSKGATLTIENYRYGNSLSTNIEPGALNVLKSSIPYIDRVTNRRQAKRGTDAESVESGMARMPGLLRSRERAVTADDFEFLSMQQFPDQIGRVQCIQPTPDESVEVIPGQFYVLVIPRLYSVSGYISAQSLEPPNKLLDDLRAYLDRKRLLTARIHVTSPEYHWVAVQIKARLVIGAAPDEVRNEILARLYRFLNPLIGGEQGKGWPFGRSLSETDIGGCLYGLPEVLYISQITLCNVDADGKPRVAIGPVVEVSRHGTIASGLHQVEFL